MKRVKQYCYGLAKRRRSKGIQPTAPPSSHEGLPNYLNDRKLDDRKPVRTPSIDEIRTVLEWEAQKYRKLFAKLQKVQAHGKPPLEMNEFLKVVTEVSPPRDDIAVLTKDGMRKTPNKENTGALLQLYMARWGLMSEDQESLALAGRLFKQYIESGFEGGFGLHFSEAMMTHENDDAEMQMAGGARNHMHLPQHIKKAAKRLLDEKVDLPTDEQIAPLVTGSRVTVKRVKQYLTGLYKRKKKLDESKIPHSIDDEITPEDDYYSPM